MLKTIAKNRKAFINDLFSKAKNCVCLCLDNGFIGKPVSKEWMIEMYHKYGKLVQHSETIFHIDIHSNCWYEFEI